MKRPLKSSEKVLLGLCAGVLLLLCVLFTLRDHRTRTAAAREKIERLEPQLTAAAAAAEDAPFWSERQTWLDATMPTMGDAGQAHSLFLQQLQSSARRARPGPRRPVLLKPEATPHHRDLAITLQITGPDQALYHWLAELQSPEKFQLRRVPPPHATGSGRHSGGPTAAHDRHRDRGPIVQAMEISPPLALALALLTTAAGPALAAEPAIPAPVSAAHFTELIERPPFRRYLSLSEALVLSGVARLPDGPVVTVWNRTTGETFVVTAMPNPQGWN